MGPAMASLAPVQPGLLARGCRHGLCPLLAVDQEAGDTSVSSGDFTRQHTQKCCMGPRSDLRYLSKSFIPEVGCGQRAQGLHRAECLSPAGLKSREYPDLHGRVLSSTPNPQLLLHSHFKLGNGLQEVKEVAQGHMSMSGRADIEIHISSPRPHCLSREKYHSRKLKLHSERQKECTGRRLRDSRKCWLDPVSDAVRLCRPSRGSVCF